MVELRAGEPFDESEVIGHVRADLAAYRSPKRLVVVDTIGRAPNGKVDYQRLRNDARAALTNG